MNFQIGEIPETIYQINSPQNDLLSLLESNCFGMSNHSIDWYYKLIAGVIF